MSTLTAEDQRRRRKVLQPGESIHFSLDVMDGATPRRAFVTDSRRNPTDRDLADAYDAMVADMLHPRRAPVDAAGVAPPVADGDPVASAYDAMVADLTRRGR